MSNLAWDDDFAYDDYAEVDCHHTECRCKGSIDTGHLEAVWVTAQKKRIPIMEMACDHLQNTINLIKRKASESGRPHHGWRTAWLPILEAEQARRNGEEVMADTRTSNVFQGFVAETDEDGKPSKFLVEMETFIATTARAAEQKLLLKAQKAAGDTELDVDKLTVVVKPF